jgi:hypothetical protein
MAFFGGAYERVHRGTAVTTCPRCDADRPLIRSVEAFVAIDSGRWTAPPSSTSTAAGRPTRVAMGSTPRASGTSCSARFERLG